MVEMLLLWTHSYRSYLPNCMSTASQILLKSMLMHGAKWLSGTGRCRMTGTTRRLPAALVGGDQAHA
jgi:hypothetical protein